MLVISKIVDTDDYIFLFAQSFFSAIWSLWKPKYAYVYCELGTSWNIRRFGIDLDI